MNFEIFLSFFGSSATDSAAMAVGVAGFCLNKGESESSLLFWFCIYSYGLCASFFRCCKNHD
ncbi:hypothetical protein Hanom_Chr09g00775941 [Helianthus anomalus]